MDEEKIQQVIEGLSEGSYWKMVYDTAPSPAAKRYWVLSFCRSSCKLSENEYEECLAEMKEMQDRMSAEDWRHFRKHCGNWPCWSVAKYREKLLETGELSLEEWEWLSRNVGKLNPFRDVCLRKVEELSGQQDQSSAQESSGAALNENNGQ